MMPHPEGLRIPSGASENGVASTFTLRKEDGDPRRRAQFHDPHSEVGNRILLNRVGVGRPPLADYSTQTPIPAKAPIAPLPCVSLAVTRDSCLSRDAPRKYRR